ncbi:MAG: preprotein translocase subunit SecE [Firmicutes bacterium HGW-Firmicutes-18]|jgi:preprotein translocase subunit SecE|nr:MAG: preprotein translocase subunit SecE [Firmicutes bacterium HGW-Firmicutes-18]
MSANTGAKKSGRVSNFFKGVRSELRKVSWPTRKELVNYTMVVMAVVTLMTLVVWALDLVFNGLFSIFV